MSRSGGILICAVLAFIGSALALIYGTIAIYQLQAAATNHSRLPFTRESLWCNGALSLVAGVWGVIATFGLLNHREWARISILAFAWLCLVFCLLPMLFFPWIPLPRIEGTSANFNLIFRLSTTAFFLFFVGIGSWWLTFFSKESVKEEFKATSYGAEMPASSNWTFAKRPLGVSIVAWYLLITAFIFAATFYYPLPAYSFTWSELRLIKVAYVGIHVFTFVGLIELKPWSRVLAICYFSLLILCTLASVWIPVGHSGFQRLVATAPVSLGLGWYANRYSLSVGLALAVFCFVAPLGILVRQKQAFVKSV